MANQMKGGSWRARATKAGTTVRKAGTVEAVRFQPREQGILAHGKPVRVESIAEAKDRML